MSCAARMYTIVKHEATSPSFTDCFEGCPINIAVKHLKHVLMQGRSPAAAAAIAYHELQRARRPHHPRSDGVHIVRALPHTPPHT